MRCERTRRHTDPTVTLAAHARRGLINDGREQNVNRASKCSFSVGEVSIFCWSCVCLSPRWNGIEIERQAGNPQCECAVVVLIVSSHEANLCLFISLCDKKSALLQCIGFCRIMNEIVASHGLLFGRAYLL